MVLVGIGKMRVVRDMECLEMGEQITTRWSEYKAKRRVTLSSSDESKMEEKSKGE
jgi:hypothetical protein